jgi:hypothetical protein
LSDEKEKDPVATALASIQELVSLESRTYAAETNAFGLLRERLAPAARYGEPIQIRYRRLHYQTPREAEQWGYLPEGFLYSDSGKLLSALLVVDNYTLVEIPNPDAPRIGQYTGDRLYLTKDGKWIFAERVGAFSEEPGSSSQWDAQCRGVSDRALLERYSLEVVTEGLFAATNKIWEKISPRLEALKKRCERVEQVSSALSKLKGDILQQTAPLVLPAQESKATAGIPSSRIASPSIVVRKEQ